MQKDSRWQTTYRVLTAAFILLCAFPLYALLIPAARQTTTTENRLLAEWPEKDTPPREYITGVEEYFNDHLAWRENLIGIYNRMTLSLGALDSDSVILGQDGWLYYKREGSLEDILRQSRYENREMEMASQFQQKLANNLADMGMDYYLMFCSDKHTIYPEYLPERLMPTGENPQPSKLEAFLQAFSEQTDVRYIDTREALLRGKSSQRLLYYKTDTHWNLNGAFIGYTELMKMLQEDYPDIHIVSEGDYTITESPVKGGDLAAMAHLQAAFDDMAYTYTPNFTSTVQEAEVPEEYATLGTLLIYENPAHPEYPTCVMFCDSFSIALRAFLPESFSRIVFVHTSTVPAEIILSEMPDMVIGEYVERGANNLVYQWHSSLVEESA